MAQFRRRDAFARFEAIQWRPGVQIEGLTEQIIRTLSLPSRQRRVGLVTIGPVTYQLSPGDWVIDGQAGRRVLPDDIFQSMYESAEVVAR